MSLCTVCGRYMCDHSPEERGQTVEEMMRPLNAEEKKAFNRGDDAQKLALAKKNAHLPLEE